MRRPGTGGCSRVTGRRACVTRHGSWATCQEPGVTGRIFLVSCLALLTTLAGCAAQSPKTHYYSLSVEEPPAPAGEASPASTTPVTRVSVTRVGIPALVDRPQIVSGTAANSVDISDFHRWAEPLQEAIGRVVAGDLARRLGPGYVVGKSVLPGMPPDVRVALDVQRFEATLGTGVAVEALWTVRAGTSEARVGRSRIEEPAADDGYAGVAAAYSRALAAVSHDIAAAVSAAAGVREK